MIKPFVFASLIIFTTLTIFYINYQTQLPQDLDCGLTPDFLSFLNANGNYNFYLGYSSYDFNNGNLKCGAYGGKSSSSDQIKKIPVIFVHGNSDVAFGRGTTDGKNINYLGYKYWQTGFRSLATYLTGQGYTKAELYTTTWGTGNDANANNVYHSKEAVMKMRKFV